MLIYYCSPVLAAVSCTVCILHAAGTGKTTFIKALAAHTKRSIINIPLSRISTNQQLMDFMYDERVKVRRPPALPGPEWASVS
jgi:ABC-type branched-subunit amino acid transport system ATPase component